MKYACLVMLAVLALPGCTYRTEADLRASAEAHPTPEAYTADRQLVVDYVRQNRKWPDDSYLIEYVGEEDTYIRFYVTHIAAARHMSPDTLGGDGKSFGATVNRQTHQVQAWLEQ